MSVITLVGGYGETAMFLADYTATYFIYEFGSTYGGSAKDEGVKGMISSRNKLVFLGNTYSYGFGDEDYWMVMFKADTLIPDHKINYYTHSDTIGLSPIDIKENEEQHPGLLVFPNPVSRLADLKVTNPVHILLHSCQLMDMEGRVLLLKELNNKGSFEINLSDLNLSSGIYFLRIVSPDASKVVKIVITD